MKIEGDQKLRDRKGATQRFPAGGYKVKKQSNTSGNVPSANLNANRPVTGFASGPRPKNQCSPPPILTARNTPATASASTSLLPSRSRRCGRSGWPSGRRRSSYPSKATAQTSTVESTRTMAPAPAWLPALPGLGRRCGPVASSYAPVASKAIAMAAMMWKAIDSTRSNVLWRGGRSLGVQA
ncbi:hypothetical protein VM1G_11823 [Cytospora mali]|uniref:Uncharacterized protein n=1 Tax=Cytospora mali TaxID=578113 RepID=A0A194W6X4_CYTMA|nr:hypothetical protein VM1G_11823 [Valsa mali]